MFAILSDIHGNRHALAAALDRASSLGATRTLVLGDVVGYGPFPGECLRLVRGAEVRLRGNHEAGVLGELPAEWFNDVAWEVVKWTRARLSAGEIATIAGWPPSAALDGFQLAHGSLAPGDPFDYLDKPSSLRRHFAAQTEPLCFVGHTHAPRIWTEGRGEPVPWPVSGVYRPEPGRKTVINVGGAGFCRDDDLRPSWVTYDPPSGEVRLHRVDYDVEPVVGAIRQAGHAPRIEGRLLADLGR